MSALKVVFEIPEQISNGLASGTLQRVGGVILESRSKQVVAWLRDNAMLEATNPAMSSLPTGISAMFLSALPAGQVLNLSVMAVSLWTMTGRLDRLSDEITNLRELVGSEFAKDRDIRFRVALQAARDAIEGSKPENRSNAMRSAVDGLYGAMEGYLGDIDRSIDDTETYASMYNVHHMLMCAMYAEVSRIRCYLANDEIQTAKNRLAEDLPRLAEYIRALVLRWLGKHPAIYLHKTIETPDLKRFLLLQRWLQSEEVVISTDLATSFIETVDRLRGDFWNTDLIQDEYGHILDHITRRPVRTFSERANELIERLTHAEILIENYQRLLGYEMELRSLRLVSDEMTLQEWEQFISEDKFAQNEFGAIVDQNILASLS